jgi:hypothetical protein
MVFIVWRNTKMNTEELEEIDSQKLEIKKQFDEWMYELEGYSFRYERFWDDVDSAINSNDNQRIMTWMRTAFQMGYCAGSRIYGGTE